MEISANEVAAQFVGRLNDIQYSTEQAALSVRAFLDLANPSAKDVLCTQADLAYFSGAYADALKLNDLLLQFEPTENRYRRRAQSLLYLERYTDAESAARQAIGLDSTRAAGWTLLGAALIGQGDALRAIDAFVRALQLDPRNNRARTFLIRCYTLTGQPEKAREAALLAHSELFALGANGLEVERVLAMARANVGLTLVAQMEPFAAQSSAHGSR